MDGHDDRRDCPECEYPIGTHDDRQPCEPMIGPGSTWRLVTLPGGPGR